jgi:hypothetical protein
MARRCLCDRLRERIATDPRLATLPMAAKWMWLQLAERAAATEDGVLRLGSAFGFLTGIAMVIQCAETEAETQWPVLEARGLLARQGDDVHVPEVAGQVTRRAAQARINGLKGGRTRKGETPEQARARRAQGALLLPVEGGEAPPEAKPTETEQPKPVSPVLVVTESKTLPGSPPPEAAREASSIGCAVAQRAGLDPVRQRFDYQPVREWLAMGADRAAILAAVGEVSDRAGFEPNRVRSLRYFTPAVERALADREARRPARADGPLTGKAAAIEAWMNDGMDWDQRPVFAA